jgi:Helix-turn-helix domain
VEYREADTRQVTGGRASGDDTAQFLRELRQLRHGAGLGHAELAARAHFPYDSIVAAEAGPALPDLPVLSAYVRACGGTTEEWEERWRSLTSSPSLPLSASRNGGRSDAATAGARISSAPQAGESPDPSIIIAALGRVAEEMASPNTDGIRADAVPTSSDIQPADDIPSSGGSFLPTSPPAAPSAYPSAPKGVDPLIDPFAPASPFASDSPLASDSSLASDAAAFLSASEPVTSSKPAGWDPIRVSTAWPAIRDTPTVAAEPAGGTGSSGETGVGAPWGATAPSAEESKDAAWPGSGTALSGTGAPAAGRRSPSGAGRVAAAASGSGPSAGRHGGSGRSASWTRVVVVAAVLLCVLAVLLAVFA